MNYINTPKTINFSDLKEKNFLFLLGYIQI